MKLFNRIHLFNLYLTSAAYTVVQPDFVKSPTDGRDYLGFTLDNGIRTVVVSDPSAKKTSVKLSVLSGSIKDPVSSPGVAYLLSQVVETCFRKSSGAKLTAFSGVTSTEFKFSVEASQLNVELDRLCSCLEVTEINQDNFKEVAFNTTDWDKVQNHLRRLDYSYAWPKYPTAPRSFSEIQQDLKGYFTGNYVAEDWRLAVVGDASTSSLASIVDGCFSRFHAGHVRSQANFEGAFGDELIQVAGENNTLYFQFLLPSQKGAMASKPLEYVEFLILRNSNGTLVDSLLKRKWATGIKVDPSQQVSDPSLHIFTLAIQLTEEGLGNVRMIRSMLFEYIDLIQNDGIRQIYFNEQKFYNHRYFEFPAFKIKGPSEILYWVDDREMPGERLVDALNEAISSDCPFYLAWKCTRDLETFDPSKISEVLEYFVPKNMRSILVSNKESSEISTTPARQNSTGFELLLPIQNKYFPTSYPDQVNSQEMGVTQVFKNSNGVLWHTFGGISSGQTVFKFQLSPNQDRISKEHEAKLDLLKHFLNELISEMADLLEVADQSLSIRIGPRGLEITLYASQSTTFEILNDFLNLVLSTPIAQETFDLAKQAALEGQETYAHGNVFQQLFREGLAPLVDTEFAPIHLVNTTHELTLLQMQTFSRDLFEYSYVEIMCFGDVDQVKLMEFGQRIIPNINPVAAHPADFPRPVNFQETGASLVYPMILRDSDIKDTTTLIYWATYSLDDKPSLFNTHILTFFMEKLLKPNLTSELGHAIIQLQPVSFLGGPIIVVTSKKDPIYIEAKIEERLIGLHSAIQALPATEFNSYLKELTQSFSKSKTYQKVNRYWDSVRVPAYNFNWETELITYTNTFEKFTLLNFISTKILYTSKRRFKYSVHLVPKNSSEVEPTPISDQPVVLIDNVVIHDGLDWRHEQSFCPYPEGFRNQPN